VSTFFIASSIKLVKLSIKLTLDAGYLYENAVAQTIVSSGKTQYYHTWEKQGSTPS